jgi:hypothetical protein
MPRVKRWFPVNHNINRDPEVWVMRREIGEKSFSIWMEFLSIADQNESELPGDYDQLIRSVSGTCQSTVRTVTAVYQYAVSKAWIKSDPTPHIAKYWKYHIERDAKKNLIASLPSEPSEPSEPKNAVQPPAAPVDNSKNGPEPKRGLDPRIKEVADRIYHKDPDRFRRLITWIKDKEKRDYPVEVIVETLSQFEARDRNTKIKDWWPYMERIHTKVYGQWNEAQAARVKDSENKFVLSLVTTVGGGMKP